MNNVHADMAAPALVKTLHGETPAIPPIWLMRQAGRYLPEYRALRAEAGSFLGLCMNPAMAAEVTIQPIDRFGLDAAILFADILLIPMAMGQELTFAEGEGPRLFPPVRNREDVQRLSVAPVAERLAPVMETVALVRARLPRETALIGFAGAPWTVATYMVEGSGSPDQARARMWAYRDPDGFSALIDLLIEATIDYLVAQIDAGAQTVQLFDTWAGTLPPAAFRRWSLTPMVAIARAIADRRPGIPVIAFARVDRDRAAELAATGAFAAIGLGTEIDPAAAAAGIDDRVALQGNLDPLVLIAGGDALDQGIDTILHAFSGRRLIFNLGHGIRPDTPPEHVARLVERVRNHKG